MPRKRLAMFYAKMVITYWLVITIVIVLMLPIYKKSLNSDKQDIVNQMYNEIQMHYTNLSKQIQLLPSVAESVYRNTSISSLSQLKNSDPNLPSKLYDVYLDQQHYLWITPVDASCCMVQFKDNDTLVTNQSVYASKEFFYNYFYMLPNVNYENWQNGLWNTRKHIELVENLCLNNEIVNCILYHYYYPSVRNPSMIVTIVIDVEKLKQELLFDRLENFGQAELHLTNGSESVSLIFGNTFGNLALFSQSINGTSLTVQISEDVFEESRRESLQNLFSYIIPAVLSATLLSLGCAFFYTKPLAKIMDLLNIHREKDNSSQNMYNDICTTFNEIINDNNIYAQEREIFREELIRIIIRLSIEKTNVSGENLLRLSEGVPALKGSYSILAIEFKNIGVNQNANFLSRLIPMFINSFTIDNDTITYILIPSIPNGNEENIIYCIETALSYYSNENINAFFGISPCCSDIRMLPKSFEYAREALLQAYLNSESKIAVYSAVENRNANSEILDVERFSWIIENGTAEMLETFWNKLLLDINVCTSQMLEAKLSFYSMLRVLRKESIVYSLNVHFTEYDNSTTLLRNMNMLKELAGYIQDQIVNKRTEQLNNTAGEVLSYIREHAFSDELSLSLIADHFNFSERYVYKLIQEQTGMSYIEYVLLLRINEAKRLLVISNSTIKDIALAVGYTNIGSFNKLFKNKVGNTPQEFRKKHREGEGIAIE